LAGGKLKLLTAAGGNSNTKDDLKSFVGLIICRAVKGTVVEITYRAIYFSICFKRIVSSVCIMAMEIQLPNTEK
jgi:hypothetical protein